MHDLIFAVAFVAMVATPAMVAAIGGRKEYNPGPEAPSLPLRPTTAIKVNPVTPVARPRAMRKIVPADHPLVTCDGPTLPMHNARGMANR
jgi:acetaldehyde dehydrogenase (acetylating)